jgi:hypothetical protein
MQKARTGSWWQQESVKRMTQNSLKNDVAVKKAVVYSHQQLEIKKLG